MSRVEVLSLLILLFSELFCPRLSGLRRIAVAVHSTHALRTCTSAAQALCPIRVGGGSRLEPSATESIRCTLERTPPHQRHRRCSVRHVTCGWPGAVCAHCERTFRESIEGRSQRQVVGGSANCIMRWSLRGRARAVSGSEEVEAGPHPRVAQHHDDAVAAQEHLGNESARTHAPKREEARTTYMHV